jgi:hypothetical protein
MARSAQSTVPVDTGQQPLKTFDARLSLERNAEVAPRQRLDVAMGMAGPVYQCRD